LFAYGSLSAVRQSDYDRKISLIDVEIAERDLSVKVIQTFYSVILNQKLLEVLNRQLGVLNETLKTSQSRYQTGRGQLLDLLQVKTQMAILKPKIADAQNKFISAGAQLADLMGGHQKTDIVVKGDLVTMPLPKIDSRLNLKDPHLPELERVRLLREQIHEAKDIALGKNLPTLGLIGDYGVQSYTKSDLFSNYSQLWSVGLQLTIPLFSGFSSVYEQRKISSQDYQLEFQSRNLLNDLQFKQIQARKTLESADANLASAEEASKLANDSINEARRNFRLATIDFIVYLNVQNSSLTADSQLYQIKFDNISAVANYFVASGQSISTLVDMLEEKK
jgi:outer membrane protein